MFVRNLDAFTRALGVQNAPIVFALAQVPWPSDEERNQFIQDLTGISISNEDSYAN